MVGLDLLIESSLESKTHKPRESEMEGLDLLTESSLEIKTSRPGEN